MNTERAEDRGIPGKSILVVEDEAAVAIDLAHALTELGYAVLGPAGSGAEALELAWRRRPDLAILDIGLPGGMDGIALAERLRRELVLPVVFLSASSDPRVLERARATAPFAYLFKPFHRPVLQTTIEVSLHRHLIERKEAAARSKRIAELEDELRACSRAYEHALREFEATEYLNVGHWSQLRVHAQDLRLILEERLGGEGDPSRARMLERVRQSARAMEALLDRILSGEAAPR